MIFILDGRFRLGLELNDKAIFCVGIPIAPITQEGSYSINSNVFCSRYVRDSGDAPKQ